MALKSNWAANLTAFFVGVVGAMQVGRTAPAAETLIAELSLELTTLEGIVSLVTLATAVFGLVAGHWLTRYKRVFLAHRNQ